MTECSRCHAPNEESARFCEDCGNRLEVVCPGCGQPITPGKKFCRSCGAPVTAAPPRFSSPQAYTPKHLAEKILTSRDAIEGERKQVTVLFCDIADSSQLAERLDPEAMHQLMDRALRLMAEAVHRYEGTVNQFLGDGLMALFGAPVALEDHALRAVQAALTIQETFGGFSRQLTEERGVTLRLRQGLNTGIVVVGRIGDDLRMDYTAVGDTTHLAARVQGLAEPGTILVTEATHRLVSGYVRSQALGPVAVKGRTEPAEVHRIVGRQQSRTRLEVSAQRGLTRLVGRERELGVLHDCLSRVKAGRSQAVGIVGEAGVGRSRLLYEFRKSLEDERITWLEGHCVAYGQTTPYLPILEILRANFQIEEGDNSLQIEEKLRRGVHGLDPGLEGVLPFLHALFDSPGADETLKDFEPKARRQKTFEAIRTLAAAGSQRRPHIVVVEDLHWIDKTSEDYLAFFASALSGIPLLLVTTNRPGYTIRWAGKPYYTQISLDVLTQAETEALVTAVMGGRKPPTDLLRIVHAKAEGNPLFVEEITRSLLERAMLGRRNGEAIPTGGTPVEVPASIQDLIRARIDRLDEPVKRTVQAAAVIGREFGVRLLSRISGTASEVQQHLDTLKNVELIHEARFFPEVEFIFTQVLIQEVAYQSLLTPRRTELHGAIGHAIEELYPGRRDEQTPMLAYHFARSERHDKAIEYALLAGNRAAGLYANAEAKSYYEQALAMARALPVSPESQRAEIDSAVKLTAVGATGRDIDRDRQNLERARLLAGDLGDERRMAVILYWIGRLHYLQGDSATALTYAGRSLDIADRIGDDALAAPPVNLIGRACYLMSEFARAVQMLDRSVEQMRRLGNKAEEATAAGFASNVSALVGDFDRAIRYGEDSIRLAEEMRNPFVEAAAYQYRGQVRAQRGEWASAIEDYVHATTVAERAGDVFRVYIVKWWQGRARFMSGDAARGRVLIEESLELAAGIGTKFGLFRQKTFLADCLLACGEPETVPQVCEEAIRLSEESGDRWMAAHAYRTLAEARACLQPGDRDSAENAIGVAMRIQHEIGARPELARSCVSYARLLDGWGDHTRARERLTGAVAMFREMGMAWDRERAEQALRDV